MRTAYFLLLASSALALGFTVACGDDTTETGNATTGTDGSTTSTSATTSTTGSGGGTTTGTGGAGGGTTTSAGGGGTGGTGGAAGCSGATPVELTVLNYVSWCSVSVAGMAESTAAEQKVCVANGAVDLAATAVSGFILGPTPWHDTDGDSGNGDPGTVNGMTSSTTVTVTGTTGCVWACCPFPNGTGCPTTDQCP